MKARYGLLIPLALPALLAFGSARGNSGSADSTARGWVKLNPDREPIARTFTGIAAGDGRIFYFGGGHAGWPGNDVEVYDMGANVWRQSYSPDFPAPGSPAARSLDSGGSSCAVDPLSGRPYTEHTYQQYAYVPQLKRVILQLCRRTWAYDPESKIWTDLEPGNVPFGYQPATGELGLSWDPGIQKVVLVGTSRYRRTYHYDPAKNTFAARTAHPLTPWRAWPRLAYSPDHARHFVVHAGRAFLYDARRDEWSERAAPPPRPIGAVVYDTVRRRFALWGLDRLVEHWGDPPSRLLMWFYDVEGDNYEQIDTQGSPGLQHATGLPNVVGFDPDRAQYVLVLPVSGYTSGGWTWEAPFGVRWIRAETWGFRFPKPGSSPRGASNK